MPKDTLSRKALKIAVKHRSDFSKAKAEFEELLRPKNSGISVKKVKWQVSKGDW